MAEERESGYSLIEVMVVVAVIGAVMMAMMPTFSGASRRTHDRSAQAALRQAMTAAASIDGDQTGWFATGGSCAASAIGLDDLESAEPSLTFESGPEAPTRYASIAMQRTSTCSRLRLITRASADRFYGVELSRKAVLGYCSGTRAEVGGTAPCDASGW